MLVTTRWFPFEFKKPLEKVMFFAFGTISSSLRRPSTPVEQHHVEWLHAMDALDLEQVARELREGDGFVVGYTEDGIYPNTGGKKFDGYGEYIPTPNGPFGESIRLCDLLITTYRGCVDLYKQFGCENVIFVPPSCSKSFLGRKVADKYEYDVVFMGNYSGDDPRYADRKPVVEAVKNYCDSEGLRFAIFGGGWEWLVPESSFFRDGLLEAISSSKIAFSLHRTLLSIPWWDCCFSDSVAKLMSRAGCLAICDNMPGCRDIFGEELVTFDTSMDLIGMIEHFLSSEDERMDLSIEQSRVVEEKFSRTVRANDVKQKILEATE